MIWNPSHPRKRWLLCYSVALALFFGLGLLFPSYLVSAFDGSLSPNHLACTNGGCVSHSSLSFWWLNHGSALHKLTFYYSSDHLTQGGYYAGSRILITGSILGAYNYGTNGETNSPPAFSCPVVADEWFNNIDSKCDIVSDISSERHNFIFNYVITGEANINSLYPDISFNLRLDNTASGRDFHMLVSQPLISTYDPSVSPDYTSILNQMASAQTSILSKLNSLDTSSLSTALSSVNSSISLSNSKLDEQTDLMSQQLEAQQQANDQQQDQYEAEKQEESDREEAGSEAIDDLTSGISFSLTDPLSYIFGAFTSSNSCVSIPTLKSWLHVSQSQFCPLFPSSIRSILTPAFSMITGIFCYGFVVKWLKKDEG